LELDYEIGEWVIRDGQWDNGTVVGSWRNSTNGTFVNSSEVCPTGMVIKPGDIISIGDTKLRVEAY
jgi:pSer/pThr/pTyr-binding forkhead associated (FHA) protein